MPQTRILIRPATTGLSGALTRTFTAISVWARRSRERAALARLDPHLLRDIGLNPECVAEECAKPGWRG